MHFARTDEQLSFAETIAALAVRTSMPDDVRRAWEPADGASPALWSDLDAVGLLTLLAPEDLGGGGTELELVAAIEQLGRAAAAGPVVEHAAVAVPLLGALAPTVLAETIERRLTLTASISDLVPHADRADVALILRDDSVLLVSTVNATPIPSLDGSRHLGRLASEALAEADIVASGADAVLQIGRARDRGALATAALLVGLSARAIEMTVAYVGIREQFGVPVGSFQAVKHQLADAYVGVEFAGPVVEAAAWALSADQPDASRVCSMAKLVANQAARTAAKVSLQCHGAIGYTMEADLHLYLMRIWSLLNSWGSSDDHRDRVATSILSDRVPS